MSQETYIDFLPHHCISADDRERTMYKNLACFIGGTAFTSTLDLHHIQGNITCELQFHWPKDIENTLHHIEKKIPNLEYASIFTLGGDSKTQYAHGATVHMGYDTRRKTMQFRLGNQIVDLPHFTTYVSQLQNSFYERSPLILRVQVRNIRKGDKPSIYVTVQKTPSMYLTTETSSVMNTGNPERPNLAEIPVGMDTTLSSGERRYRYHRILPYPGPLSVLDESIPSFLGAPFALTTLSSSSSSSSQPSKTLIRTLPKRITRDYLSTNSKKRDENAKIRHISFPMRVYGFRVYQSYGHAPGGSDQCYVPQHQQAVWDWSSSHWASSRTVRISRHPTKSSHGTASLYYVPPSVSISKDVGMG